MNFLLDQWDERLRTFTSNVRIGRIQQDTCSDGDFVLISTRSLLSRTYPKESLDFGLVIIDEVHHIAAPFFSKMLGKLRTKYTLGLTATPKRKDGLEEMIYLLVGAPAYQMKIPDNPDVQVNFVRCSTGGMREVKYKNGRIGLATMITRLTQNHGRNQLILRIIGGMLQRSGQGLLLSDRVDHLRVLHEMIESVHEGKSAIICGKINTDRKDKDEKIQFRKEITLSTFSMFAEAVDFHGDYIILATPKSNIEQATGRILRGHSSNRPVIIDLFDPFSIFFALMSKRRKFYASRGYEILDLKM